MQRLLDGVISIARDAATDVMAVYESGATVRHKKDGSAVTDADERASGIISRGLASLVPECIVICEESCTSPGAAHNLDRFWLVDPLDGTREFLDGNGEFTVNIALIEAGRAVLGVVIAPALDRLFGGIVGGTAFVEENGERRPLRCRVAPAEGVTVVASRSHLDADAMAAFLGTRSIAGFVKTGSSLKFCMVAAGEADLYPRLGTTMEWDTAAGHAVLSAAGGRVECVDGRALAYGKPGLVNPHFIAMGR